MKKTIIILIFFSMLFCKKQTDDIIYWGSAEALRNGENWSAKPYAAFNTSSYGKDTVFVVLHRFNAQNYLREEISFYRIPFNIKLFQIEPFNYTGNYKINSVASTYNTLQAEGDVLGDTYAIDTLANNSLEVLSFDKEKGEIELRFNAQFLLKVKQTSNPPDTVIFESGYVKTRVYNQ